MLNAFVLENLVTVSPPFPMVVHSEIGRFFSGFDPNTVGYIMNNSTDELYPEG